MKLNGTRLKEARYFRKMTITDLAEKIGVTKQMISRYERETGEPSLETFQKIVSALKFPVNFFTESDSNNFCSQGTFYRSRLTATQTEKRPSEFYQKAACYIRDYFETMIEFPELPKFDRSFDSPEEAANYIRKIWRLGATPIPNMIRLLEEHSIIIYIAENDSKKVNAHSGWMNIGDRAYFIIALDSNSNNFFNQQFSLAHELGHYVLHSGVNPQIIEKEEYRKMEQEAEEFASCFLLPSDMFKKSICNFENDLEHYIALKFKWYTSMNAMVVRARHLRLIDADTYSKLQKRISYRKWRKKEPGDEKIKLMKPQVFKMAFNLLVDNGLLEPSLLSDEIAMHYQVSLPNEVLSQIIGIDLNKFKGEIVKLKVSNK